MSITTVDGLIAGSIQPDNFFKISGTLKAVGAYHSLFYATGKPGQANPAASGINGNSPSGYSGALPFTNPGAGNTYIRRIHVNSSAFGVWTLCDRIWHNSGIVVTTTTAQTIASTAWTARDETGTTNGSGVYVGIEMTAAATNAGAITNCTLNYTNELGTAGRTGTIVSINATPANGQFFPFELQAGDYGVRSIQGITLGTSFVTGSMSLVAFRPLLMGSVSTADRGEALDPITGGFVQLYNNSTMFFLWQASATTAVTLTGYLKLAQG